MLLSYMPPAGGIRPQTPKEPPPRYEPEALSDDSSEYDDASDTPCSTERLPNQPAVLNTRTHLQPKSPVVPLENLTDPQRRAVISLPSHETAQSAAVQSSAAQSRASSKLDTETKILSDESDFQSLPRPIPEPYLDPEQVESLSEDRVVDETEPEWDFILPQLPAPPSLTPGIGKGNDNFDLETLVGALQNGMNLQFINSYLGYYDKMIVKRHLNGTVEGFPSIFWSLRRITSGLFGHGFRLARTFPLFMKLQKSHF